MLQETTDLDLALKAAQADLVNAEANYKATQSRLQLALRTAQANLASSQANLEATKSNPQLALNTAQANLASSLANLEAAKAKNAQNPNQLIIAKGQLEKATIAVQHAQSAYDSIAWDGGAGARPEAAALQQATIDRQIALANYDLTAATINDSALRAAQAASWKDQIALKQEQLNLDTALRVAQAALTSAKIALEQAQSNQDISLRAAQAALDSAKIALEQAQSNQDKTKILAPFDGTIAAVNYSVGNSAGAGTAVEVVNLSSLQVNTILSKMDAPKVKAGDPAQMTLDELPGKTYTATVMSVGPVPVGATPGAIPRGVVNYPVVFSIENSDGAIKPGMTTKLNVEVARRDHDLLIPSGAVQVLGASKFVTVLVNGQPIQTPITTGLSNDQFTEVTSGLKEGDAVVLNP
jgi:RND family efflux transporter MFP subunit